jgi:predicted metal-dependent peptidase
MAHDPVVDKIISARVYMLMNMPFFGNLATRLKIIDASDWVPTAGTDGRHFYYNRKFIESLDKKELVFLVGHEVMHCCYDHMERRGSRDAQLWNMAADYVINYELVEQHVGKLIHRPAKFKGDPDACEPCYDQKYAGMSADQIYELLKEEWEKSKGKMQGHQFDVHMDPNSGNGDDPQDGDVTGKSGPIPMSAEEKAILKDEIKQAVLEAAKAAGAGNTPGGVRRMLKDLTEPQMDWRELLNAQVQSCVKSDYTFAKPSRKNASGCGAILPGMLYDQMIEVAVCVDTSGSISESMIRDFLGEVRGIMDQFQDFKLKIWFFDTATYTVHDFTPDNADDIATIEVEGGGGTLFEVNWDLMKEQEFEPHQFIMFTDGYPGRGWGDPDYVDTIFVIHGNDSIVAPFGLTAYYAPPKSKQ